MATRTPAKKTAPKRSASTAAVKKAPSSKANRVAPTKPAAKKTESAKTGAKKSNDKPAAKEVAAAEVSIDRRRKPRREDAAQTAAPAPVVAPAAAPVAKLERRAKVNRRRQIDPTTCERDYSGDEVEFMNALDEYKRRNGRMFPTCSEVLEVVRSLGYAKATLAGPTTITATETDVAASPNAAAETIENAVSID